jgi:hypothetical protein
MRQDRDAINLQLNRIDVALYNLDLFSLAQISDSAYFEFVLAEG